jgi:hypothetical protein
VGYDDNLGDAMTAFASSGQSSSRDAATDTRGRGTDATIGATIDASSDAPARSDDALVDSTKPVADAPRDSPKQVADALHDSPAASIDAGDDAHPHDAGTTKDAATDAPVVDLDLGLVAYWKLDGDGTDATGINMALTGLAGTVNNPPMYATGKIGEALYPGLGTDFNCENCTALQSPDSTNAALQFKSGTSDDFTVSMWAQRITSANVDGTWWRYALLDNAQVTIAAEGTGAYPTPAYPTMFLYANGTQLALVQDKTFDFRAAANTGVWVHVIAFRQGTTIGLRVNGNQTTATISGSVGTSGRFSVAEEASGYPWQGYVDEVGKWNRALSPAEMDALYNGGAGRTLP